MSEWELIGNFKDLVKYLLYCSSYSSEINVGINGDTDIQDKLDPKFANRVRKILQSESM